MVRICFTQFFPNGLQLNGRWKVIQEVRKSLVLQIARESERPVDKWQSPAGGWKTSDSEIFSTLKITVYVNMARHVLELRVVAEDHQTELDATDDVSFTVKK